MPFPRVETFESTTSGVSATSSEVVEMQAARKAFEAATSVEQLQDLTVAFLRGDLTATSYHLGSLADIPPSFVDSLVNLNHLGFITTGSQVGGTEQHRGERVEKRFYVEGILHRRYLARFLREMYIEFGERVFISVQERDRSYEEIQDLKNADLYCVGRVGSLEVNHIPEVNGPCLMFQTCDEVYSQLTEEYCTIFIMGTEWGAPGADILLGINKILGTLKQGPRKVLSPPTLPTLSRSLTRT